MSLQLPQSSECISLPQVETTFKHPAKHRLAQSAAGLLIFSLLTGGSYLLYRQFVLVPKQQEQTQTQTVTVETATLPITVAANGTVEPEQLTNVSPKTSERLEQVTVAEGDAVEIGQVLAYMDDSDLQGQLMQAQGQLASAQANLAMLVAGNRPQEIAQKVIMSQLWEPQVPGNLP